MDTKEGLCRLLINTGGVNTYLTCNDNAVLLELAERLRRKYGQKANVTVVEEDDEEVSPPSDLRNTDLRNTLKRKPFKANFKQPITMVSNLAHLLALISCGLSVSADYKLEIDKGRETTVNNLKS